MQTFLPYPNFKETAKVLDRKRLGKQRVEGYQILKSLVLGTGWHNHPATKQWAGHEFLLGLYIEAICNEWTDRGYADSVLKKATDFLRESNLPIDRALPDWFGYEPYHSSHRARLLYKDPEYYGQFGWTEDPNIPYYWPSQH